MLKRLIGVITVKDGWAVQSIGYNRYLPLGRPEIIAENLDRWFLDEILVVCIDRTSQGLGPDLETLAKISGYNLMTPVTYAGGIRSAEDGVQLVQLGADRLCMEHLFDVDPEACRAIRDAVGVQAVIRALPLELDPVDATVLRYDYLTKISAPCDPSAFDRDSSRSYSELLIIDRQGDGGEASFSTALLEPFAASGQQIIAFGGITTKAQVEDILALPGLSAVAVGNSLSYRELANRDLISESDMHDTRTTSHGAQTRGARQW